jgi:hypothetical protein
MLCDNLKREIGTTEILKSDKKDLKTGRHFYWGQNFKTVEIHFAFFREIFFSIVKFSSKFMIPSRC